MLAGHNYWISPDCEHCEYGDTIESNEEGDRYCDADRTYRCPDGAYQTRVVITVIGDLRNRGEATNSKGLQRLR